MSPVLFLSIMFASIIAAGITVTWIYDTFLTEEE